LEAFEENCFEDFDLQIFSTLPDLDFVYLHSVKKCKVATIIGYRSAISSKHKGWGGRSVSTNGDLSKLIKGIFNSNPILKPLLPNWDLPLVLWRLCDPPFEPLLSCDIKIVTWKTVFLIAFATEFFETGLQTPFWYVINKQSESISFL
jgi:hypothetical protein